MSPVDLSDQFGFNESLNAMTQQHAWIFIMFPGSHMRVEGMSSTSIFHSISALTPLPVQGSTPEQDNAQTTNTSRNDWRNMIAFMEYGGWN